MKFYSFLSSLMIISPGMADSVRAELGRPSSHKWRRMRANDARQRTTAIDSGWEQLFRHLEFENEDFFSQMSLSMSMSIDEESPGNPSTSTPGPETPGTLIPTQEQTASTPSPTPVQTESTPPPTPLTTPPVTQEPISTLPPQEGPTPPPTEAMTTAGAEEILLLPNSASPHGRGSRVALCASLLVATAGFSAAVV